MQALLVYCLLSDSPRLDTDALDRSDANLVRVAHSGRKPGLELERDGAACALADWASELFDMLVSGRRADLARSAERVAKGQPPSGKAKKKMAADASLAANRDLNLRLLDFVVSDLLALGRQNSGARIDDARVLSLPRETAIDAGAAATAARRLLRARSDLARNVNVGLVVLDALLDADRCLHRAGA